MAKNIMFQGTGSSVGKSILTAALCRVMHDAGYKTAPFKSQNMALNSFVTSEGKEMGRAQVVQAEAARILPMVAMNPVLLKPTSDMGSQVIVNGTVYKNLSASDYYTNKRYLMDEVLKSYTQLDTQFDVIVIEGAGSPAEINLRKNDIVNMGLAEEVDAPVILIGDIDKGGVFAQILGTYMLLSDAEKKRVKGYVINKFRGDVTLLQPGIEMFKDHIPVPCLGVVPWAKIDIDDEDSVTERFGKNESAPIQIAVIGLPYLSNFTDFTVLDLEEDVSVRYVKAPNELDGADLIVLPGSKSTIKDLSWLKEVGLDEAIIRASKNNIPVMGICGGYQMLGNTITDPHHVETEADSIIGLGLLEAVTVMAKEKQTVQSSGTLMAMPSFINETEDHKKVSVEGYEIHMGITTLGEGTQPWIQLEDGACDGAISANGQVFGTYLHGVFDHASIRQAFLGQFRQSKALEAKGSFSYGELKDKAYDDLADLLREHLDMDAIMKIAGLKS